MAISFLRNCRMNLKLISCLFAAALLAAVQVNAATALAVEEIQSLTQKWKGERTSDGRPKVSSELLERMKKVSIEEAWEVLRGEGYRSQFEGGWQMIHTHQPVVGRALTAVYLPSRPDLSDRVYAVGKAEGRIGASNSWPIDMLERGDVYVADGFGKIADGTLIGDNLGNSIFAKSGNGVVFNGSVRDLEGLEAIDGFNAFVRGWDPSAIKDMVLGGINVPIRIGGVTVLPGDIVLAKREGVIFIPPHLAEKVVVTSEIVSLKDRFGHMRLREGKYTPGQIDRAWTKEIREDFMKWLETLSDKPALSKEEIEKRL
jgi:4-hydroxy-4-methyl-2-oxoglutarate aldolase